MNVYLDLENPGVSGFWNGGYMSQVRDGEVSSRATWVRGGRILSQQGGFQVSEGDRKGEQGEVIKQGEIRKQWECAMYIIYAHVHNECLHCLKDTSCIYA
jgi:hypothetical protein